VKVRRNLVKKISKVSIKMKEEGKAGGRLVRNMYQRLTFVHAREVSYLPDASGETS
jgi:hypothetical protein